jgi:hypothetical protein
MALAAVLADELDLPLERSDKGHALQQRRCDILPCVALEARRC